MDNRRVLLAIVLTFGVLTGWSLLVAPRHPEMAGPPAPAGPAREVTRGTPVLESTAAPFAAEAPDGETVAGAATVATAVQQVHIHSDLYDVTLTNRGAVIERWALERYRATVPPPGETAGPVELVTDGASYRPLSILTGDAASERELSAALYTVEGTGATLAPGEQTTVTFRWSDGQGTSVEKRLEFTGSSYAVNVAVKAKLAGGRNAYLELGPRLADSMDPAFKTGYAGRAAILAEGKVHRVAKTSISLKKLTAVTGVWPPQGDGSWLAQAEAAGQVTRFAAAGWAGVEDNYFAGLLFAPRPLREVVVAPAPEPAVHGAVPLLVAVAIDREGSELSLYMGPKDTDILKAIEPALERVIDFGNWFDSLARLLLVVLKFFHRHVRNYGLAIILLTVVVKLLFLPLSIKQLHAMQKMTKLRPQMKEIESRYEARGKGDPAERLEMNRKKNAEMMALYQREGINPASGCLPLLLQLPVLYGLLALLGASIELRHAPFVLWIQDLSAKDPLYATPILMLLSMIVMQAITPTAADPMQRRMMFLMPVLFAWIFKDLASGLGLYWLTQNVLSIVQQAVMNRWTQQREIREKEAKRQGKGKRAKVDGLEAK